MAPGPMICSAVRGTVKSDNFLVIPGRPLVIINWPVSVRRPVSDRVANRIVAYFLHSLPFALYTRTSRPLGRAKFVWIGSRAR